LPVGLRAAQIGHVLIHWALAFGEPPENLVLLEVADEQELCALFNALPSEWASEGFTEPDLDNQLTAIAVESEYAHPLLRKLPLLK